MKAYTGPQDAVPMRLSNTQTSINPGNTKINTTLHPQLCISELATIMIKYTINHRGKNKPESFVLQVLFLQILQINSEYAPTAAAFNFWEISAEKTENLQLQHHAFPPSSNIRSRTIFSFLNKILHFDFIIKSINSFVTHSSLLLESISKVSEGTFSAVKIKPNS